MELPPAETFIIEGERWTVPAHWCLRPAARSYMASASFFGRPDGTRHPDILRVDGGTIVRGRFIKRTFRKGKESGRVPDVDTELWYRSAAGPFCQK